MTIEPSTTPPKHASHVTTWLAIDERCVAPALWFSLTVFFLLIVAHALFISLHTLPPTWDEAHYLLGAAQWRDALRSIDPAQLWGTYTSLLLYKPPLISVLAGSTMLFAGNSPSAGALSLLLLFILLGMASWRLFCNIFPSNVSACASVILLSMPMLTGLTHYLYPEGLALLLMLLYLNVLIRSGWRSYRSAALLGALLGLGMLAKTTFPALMAAPSLYLLFVQIREDCRNSKRWRHLLLPAPRLLLCLTIALLLGASWYVNNFALANKHAQTAFWCEACTHPTGRTLLALASAGPYFFTSALALVGVLPLVIALYRRLLPMRAVHTWVSLLLISAVTFCAILISPNKALRLATPILPLLSALSIVGIFSILKTPSARRKSIACCMLLSLLLVLHNSFRILPLPIYRWHDLTLLSDRFPLNVPGWRDDNVPLSRTTYPFKEVATFVAKDSRRRFAGVTPLVMLSADCPYFNHNLFDYLGRRGHQLYLPVGYRSLEGEARPQYVLLLENGLPHCGGTNAHDGGADFQRGVREGHLGYSVLRSFSSADGVNVSVFVRTS